MASFTCFTMSSKSFGFAAAFMAASVLLVGCGGGGGGGGSGGITLPHTFTRNDLDSFKRLPEVKKLSTIQGIANHLDMTNIWYYGLDDEQWIDIDVTCTGTSCYNPLTRESVSLNDIVNDVVNDPDIYSIRLEKSYSNFNVAHVKGNTNRSDYQTYNIWGDYGYADVRESVSDNVLFQFGISLGQRLNDNPDVNYSYSGPVYAIDPDGYFNSGKVKLDLKISDYFNSTITVDINLTDNCQNDCKLVWDDILLRNGRFEDDSFKYDISGALYGPNHEEAYGVFDGPEWVGAFGARR